MQAAIRITHEVRGSTDSSRMLKVSTFEVAQALNVEHCCVLLFGESDKEQTCSCSCESIKHEREIDIALTSAIENLQSESSDRFVTHNYSDSTDFVPGLTSFPVCGLPLTRGANGLGGVLLVLSTDSTRLWLEDEIQMLLAVAHQLSLSVAHARVFAEKTRQSLTDPLTNCMNRRGFDEQFENDFQTATKGNRSVSLIMIDLDPLRE